jgi:hypothetical protein
LARAAAAGHTLDCDPDLHLLVDGARLGPCATARRVCRFALPAGARTVWLVSRHTVPAEVVAESSDIRRLGVPVERIVLADGNLRTEAWHGHTGFSQGFHADEAGHRWTDGRARLPPALLQPFAAPVTLEVHLAPTSLGYRVASTSDLAAA